MPLSFTKRRFDGRISVLEVSLSGFVSLSDAALLDKSLHHSLRQGYTTLVANLKNVREIDRSALDRLMEGARRLHRAHGQIILRHCSDAVFERLVERRWDGLFLVPERRAADAQALPPSLREWAVSHDDPEDSTKLAGEPVAHPRS